MSVFPQGKPGTNAILAIILLLVNTVLTLLWLDNTRQSEEIYDYSNRGGTELSSAPFGHGEQIPDFEFETTNGSKVSRNSLRGKPYIILMFQPQLPFHQDLIVQADILSTGKKQAYHAYAIGAGNIEWLTEIGYKPASVNLVSDKEFYLFDLLRIDHSSGGTFVIGSDNRIIFSLNALVGENDLKLLMNRLAQAVKRDL